MIRTALWGCQLPVVGGPVGGAPEPDMPGHLCPLAEPLELFELLDPLELLEPVAPVEPLVPLVLSLCEGVPELDDELTAVPVEDVGLPEAACATAAPPVAPRPARTASTVSLRRIGLPPVALCAWTQSTRRR